MNNLSDFEKYLVSRIDTLQKEVIAETGEIKKQIHIIDKKVTGIRARAATAASFISAIIAAGGHLVAKKLGFQ